MQGDSAARTTFQGVNLAKSFHGFLTQTGIVYISNTIYSKAIEMCFLSLPNWWLDVCSGRKGSSWHKLNYLRPLYGNSIQEVDENWEVFVRNAMAQLISPVEIVARLRIINRLEPIPKIWFFDHIVSVLPKGLEWKLFFLPGYKKWHRRPSRRTTIICLCRNLERFEKTARECLYIALLSHNLWFQGCKSHLWHPNKTTKRFVNSSSAFQPMK